MRFYKFIARVAKWARLRRLVSTLLEILQHNDKITQILVFNKFQPSLRFYSGVAQIVSIRRDDERVSTLLEILRAVGAAGGAG